MFWKDVAYSSTENKDNWQKHFQLNGGNKRAFGASWREHGNATSLVRGAFVYNKTSPHKHQYEMKGEPCCKFNKLSQTLLPVKWKDWVTDYKCLCPVCS